jgi:L-alanine-DL-glutamate epimerase-like enolase superfamily enzyme
LKITRVEAIPVSIPLRREFLMRSAHGDTAPVSTPVLVRVHTDGGVVGLGECTGSAQWSGEPQNVALTVIDQHLAPAVIGADPAHTGDITARMQKAIKAHPFAKSAVEMACWDAAGKASGQSVTDMLGGRCRDAVRIKWSVSARPPEEAAAIARRAVDLGFTMMKVKTGLDPVSDVERVRAVRDAVGPHVRVGIDCNGGWSTRHALWAIRQLDDADLWFVEQPTHPRDLAGMAEVRRSTHVPIMADESVWTAEDAIAVIRHEAADIISVYPGKNGGIGPCRDIVTTAHAAGLTCVLGSNLELGVASAAMLAVARALPGISDDIGHHIIGPLYHERDVVDPPLQLAGGHASGADGPGLGVALASDAMPSPG